MAPNIEGARGLDNPIDLFRRPEHQEAIAGGMAHLPSLPLVDIPGGEAFATSYLLLMCLNREGDTYVLPNHGPSQGYLIHRVVINRWAAQEDRWHLEDPVATASASRWLRGPHDDPS